MICLTGQVAVVEQFSVDRCRAKGHSSEDAEALQLQSGFLSGVIPCSPRSCPLWVCLLPSGPTFTYI